MHNKSLVKICEYCKFSNVQSEGLQNLCWYCKFTHTHSEGLYVDVSVLNLVICHLSYHFLSNENNKWNPYVGIVLGLQMVVVMLSCNTHLACEQIKFPT